MCKIDINENKEKEDLGPRGNGFAPPLSRDEIKTGDPTHLPRGNIFESPLSRTEIVGRLTDYLRSCRPEEGGVRSTHGGGKIPNVAGFCRACGVGVEEFDALREHYPELHGEICAILEDEALNSDLSASVLSIYLKMRLGYAEARDGQEHPHPAAVPGSQLRIVFDHDGFSDGE